MRDPIWWTNYMIYKLRWNKLTISFVNWLEIIGENFAICSRLASKKKCQTKKKLIILTRFFEMKAYKNQLKVKITQRAMSQFVAALSARTGIPQWELRTRINRDFGVDI